MVGKPRLCFDKRILVVLIVLCIQNVTSFWEYAVTTKEKILLFDKNWEQLETSIRKDNLQRLKAITYDPVEDIFFFTDQKDPETSIFSLKVHEDGTFFTSKLKPRTENEVIEDLVFDFHNSTLYYSDSKNNKINKMVFDRSKNLKWWNETLIKVSGEVSGLEIDSCKRNLYYTIKAGSNPSINMLSLDKKNVNQLSFGDKKHNQPIAMALDHRMRRLYVVDIEQYSSYSIDSIFTNGSDFRTEISEGMKMPRSIAVDNEYVYFAEGGNHDIRRFEKNSKSKASSVIKKMDSDPTDIIVRSNFITDLNPALCTLPAETINQVKVAVEKMAEKKDDQRKVKAEKMCLHGGSLDKTSSSCVCMENFDGDFCEINMCYNFCLNGGDCSMFRNEKSQKLEPQCSCKRGFIGDHCETDACTNYCLNSGQCATFGKKPKCSCTDKFTGSRCDISKSDSVSMLIDAKQSAATQTSVDRNPVTTSTVKVPESSEQTQELHGDRFEHHNENYKRNDCPDTSLKAYNILAVCTTISLLLFLIILVVVKKMNKQLRPKIRKKYVVHKNIEPLTSRPMTEQCEVIIEDCCNMNICETPCFDPKLLQQEINEANLSVKLTTSKKCNTSKEDKQDLLKNMEFNQ